MTGPYLLPVRWRRGVVPVIALGIACAVMFAAHYDGWRLAHSESKYQIQPILAPDPYQDIELHPSLTCAGTLTTTEKNTSEQKNEAVRDFPVIGDFDFAHEKISVWVMGQYQATIRMMDPFLFADSTSWEKDGSIKQFINGEIDRATGAMYAYETLWSEDGPVRIRHWVLQCTENRSPLAFPCQPFGPGICLLRLPGEWCPKTLPPGYRTTVWYTAWEVACSSERPK